MLLWPLCKFGLDKFTKWFWSDARLKKKKMFKRWEIAQRVYLQWVLKKVPSKFLPALSPVSYSIFEHHIHRDELLEKKCLQLWFKFFGKRSQLSVTRLAKSSGISENCPFDLTTSYSYFASFLLIWKISGRHGWSISWKWWWRCRW